MNELWPLSLRVVSGPTEPVVFSRVQRSKETLRVDFWVKNAKLNAQNRFSKTEPVWNLWDLDVSEVFLSSAQNPNEVESVPYFEFQVSPFAQYFELKILKPRIEMDAEFRSGVRYGAEVVSTQSWKSWLEIPLENFGFQEHLPLFGNLYCCLLRAPRRSFLALNLPEQKKVDFHVPSAFVPIAEKLC